MGLNLYMVTRSLGAPADKTTYRERETLIASYTNGTSETTLIDNGLAYVRALGGGLQQTFSGLRIKTELDAKIKYYDAVRTAPEPEVVVGSIDTTFRGQLTEDWDWWNQAVPLNADTSTGQNDGSHDHEFPGHSAEYLVVLNDSGAAIAEGAILTWASNTYNEHHKVKTRTLSTQVIAGVALEIIADDQYGKMAAGNYCDVLCSSSSATIGLPLYASASSEDRATTTTTGHFLGNSVGGIGVLGYATNWAR